MKVLGKPRKKRDGSLELPIACPVCGTNRTGQMEVNLRSRRYHCFRCHHAGAVTDEGALESMSLPVAAPEKKQVRKDSLSERFPLYAQQEFTRRKQEVAWLVHRYGVRWDGERLVFPAGAGCSRRAVLPWETPKTLSVAPKGLIGGHLLACQAQMAATPRQSPASASTPQTGPESRSEEENAPRIAGDGLAPLPADDVDAHGSPQHGSDAVPETGNGGVGRNPSHGPHVVVVEGDWKAASIPLPWIGVGLMGTSMSQEQALQIRMCNPSKVFVMMDHGYELAAEVIVTKLLPTPAWVVALPTKGGPDDRARSELVGLLLAAEERTDAQTA